MIPLLRREPRALAFGFLYTFGSSGGQTFFISVFVPAIAASLALGMEDVSFLYAAATVASALVLPFAGRMIDRIDVARFGLAVGAGLSLACVVTALANGSLFLAVGLFALRLFGQGLMTHTGVTPTARWFRDDRGKALALTSLGFAAGEALLPVTAVALIGLAGWRWSLAGSGVVLGLLAAMAAAWTVRRLDTFRAPLPRDPEQVRAGSAALWRSSYFWALTPVLLASPFAATALIFYQGLIAQSLGLDLALFAAAFVAYALARVPGSLVAGPLIDRFSGRALLPLQLLPAAIGIAVLAAAGTLWAVFVYYALIGFSAGLDGTIRSAAIAEMVAPSELGAARSFLASLAVLSTAAGPAAAGLLLATGFGISALLWGAVILFVTASLIALAANLCARQSSR